MALLIYREKSTYVKEKLRYVFSSPPDLHFIVPSVSIYMRSRGEIVKSETSHRCLSLHIELLRSGLDALVLDAARQNSWTFVFVQLFAVSYLLLTEKL
jgi:hypothetical protein